MTSAGKMTCRSFSAIALFLAASGVCVWCAAALAQENSPAAGAESTQTVVLQYHEVSSPVDNAPVSFIFRSQPFAKEPDVARREVKRGTLQVSGASSRPLPFLWDYTKGKLYLDLNCNGDLTDDPTGVFSAPTERNSGSSYYDQTFKNVHLTLNGAKCEYPLLADLNLYDYGNRPSGTLACRSFWEGKVSLQNQDWQVGFIKGDFSGPDSTDSSYLLLRPWAERDQPFTTDPQTSSLAAFPFNRNLCFNQRTYRVECVFSPQAGKPGCNLTFTEQPAELGELRVTGKFIQRLVLTGSAPTLRRGSGAMASLFADKPANPAAFTVVLDTPGPVVRIPVGNYTGPQAHLKAGGMEADREVYRGSFAPAERSVAVSATNATSLAAGGPLTNSLTIGRQGRSLSLSYQLLGADGAAYKLAREDRSKPPQFAVYQDGKRIASGSFQFG